MTSTREAVIDLVVQACKALAAAGQDDLVWGHPSIRDPGGRGVWMKSSGWGFEEVSADRVVLVSADGEVLDGGGKPHIEYPIHAEIMSRRPDVGAVVHTHSDSANAFAALDTPLLSLSHAGSLFTFPDVPRFLLTGGLIKTRHLGQALADVLGDAPACLMPQHGIVAVGKDIQHAVMTAVLLDKACRVQLAAMAAGAIKRHGPEADTVAKREEVWSDGQILAGWEYLVRRSS
ncbi:MAG: class II aldolase/adducin family protein [Actinomycetota bacterium]|jgi:L-fuculose-phosphate aldolase|nr:class II aldolase/adducin family protein [Actinomycetota bacterium]